MVSVEDFLKVERGSGYGSGSGFGYGDGDGDGDGDGYGSGYGYGSGSGSGDGYGDGYGSGSGDGYGDGYGSGSGIKSFGAKPVYRIDGVPTVIDRIKEMPIGLVAIGHIVNRDFTTTKCYVVKRGSTFAHGSTIKEAYQDCLSKMFEDMDVYERIDMFLNEFSLDKEYKAKMFYDWHNKLTGSCRAGRNAFVKDHEIDLESNMTVKQFIELTKDSYEGHVIRELALKIEQLGVSL